MSSKLFEDRDTRHELLTIFNHSLGEGESQFFTVSNLGLWAAYLTSVGLDPQQFSSIRHRLLESSFLNVAFSGKQLDPEELRRQETAAEAARIDCLMIPCVREAALPVLSNMGYVSVPGFDNCLAQLESDWEAHLRTAFTGRYRRNLLRQMRRLGSCYRTEWLSLNELIENKDLFARASEIYMYNAGKFASPAIHFPRGVLVRISEAVCAHYFRVALTFNDDGLVKVVVCFVDEASRYIAALVSGIDYPSIPSGHNLYNHMYYSIYRFVEEHGLRTFDMGRGYVQHKRRMGANRVVPLFVYLKPLTVEAEVYAETLLAHSRAGRSPSSSAPAVLA